MFYDRFITICNERNVSPSQVAIRCGFNKSSITNWKKNGYTPRQEILIKLADYFDISIDYLLGTEQNKKPPTSNTETWTVYNFEGNGTRTTTVNPNNINALKKLLNAAGDLTPEQIEALIKVAETMK